MGHRCAVLVGPYLSGKTTLMEAMLHASGTTQRRGSVRDGTTVGDHVAEARARQMSTEMNVAQASYLGDKWTILDCPGSVELAYEAQQAMLAADVAIVVCEPEVERAVTVSALLRFLSRHDIPHIIFINKLDTASRGARRAGGAAILFRAALVLPGAAARRDSGVTGYVDLVAAPTAKPPGSDLIQLPGDFWDARPIPAPAWSRSSPISTTNCWKKLLEDVQPSKEDLRAPEKGIAAAQIVPVMVGAGLQDFGVRRL